MLNSHESALLAVSVAFPILAAIFVVFRFLARRVKSAPQLDDWATIVALILRFALGTNTTIAVAKGVIGKPESVLGLSKATVLLKAMVIYADLFFCFAALAVVNIAVLLFYKRVFPTAKFSLAANIMMGVIFCWWFATFFALLFSQTPIKSHWDPLSPNTNHNVNFPNFLMTHASMNLFFDVAILHFPLPVIRTLNMAPKRKIAIMGIFWLGFFCAVAEAVRIYYFHSFLYQDLKDHADIFGPVVTNVLIWSRIEPCCSVIAACLPTLGPLLKGRSIQSMVESIRSTFSLRSTTNSISLQLVHKTSGEHIKQSTDNIEEGRAEGSTSSEPQT